MKKNLLLMFLFLVCLGFSESLFAQERVTGVVIDLESNLPLPGCSVVVKGTQQGVATNADGEFSIVRPADGAILEFSFMGFETQEIVFSGQTTLNIGMKMSAVGINEVVAIGYGTATKKELTGSVATIREDDFNKGDKIDAVSLLQGKVAGLSIVQARGGDPNQTAQFLLRGVSTLSGGVSPLIIVDGVPGVSLNSVSPTSIQSIDVLKDGSAAAIYGTRGTNGVIIITTKRAKPGAPVVEFSTYVSTQKVSKTLDALTADEFRDALAIKFPGTEDQYDHGYSTNWFDEITRTPMSYNAELSLTGGTEALNYRASVNYHDNQGLVMKNSLSRLNTSLMVDQKGLDGRLNLKYKIAYTSLDREKSDTWALQQAFRYNPTEPVYDDSNPLTGGYYMNSTPFQYYNPVAMINERVDVGTENYFTGSLDGSFEVFDGFKVGAQGSLIRNNTQNAEYNTRYYPIGIGTNGEAYKGTSIWEQKLLELRAEYSKQIGLHSFQGFAGYSYQEQSYESFSARNKSFDLDGQSYHNMGVGAALLEGTADINSYKNSSKLIAFYGRVMYNYDSKYLFSASVRREGSTKFGDNNKWGIFPAVSLGWVVSAEDFMSNLNFMDYLKLRAGYGVTGNQNIPNYMSLQLLESSSSDKVWYNGQWINTYAPASNANPNLKWEEKAEFNVGLDFALFGSKINGTVDYYDRNTYDLLWWYNVPVPPNLYPETYANVGHIRNQGFELTANYNAVAKSNFSWTTGINFSLNRNELVSFSDEDMGYELSHIDAGYIYTDIKTYTVKIEEGQSLGNFVGPVFEGIATDGTSIFKDVDGDGSINQEVDREVIGNAYPDFQLGWNNSFKYKNFDLSLFFRGVFGHDILNYHRMYFDNWAYFGSKNVLSTALENPGYVGMAEYSSRYVEDGTYIKLDNLNLGYNLKDKGPFKAIRLYFSGQQLLTITNYKGVDPEIDLLGLDPGIDNYSYYPRVKTFIFGINATF